MPGILAEKIKFPNGSDLAGCDPYSIRYYVIHSDSNPIDWWRGIDGKDNAIHVIQPDSDLDRSEDTAWPPGQLH